MRYVQHRSAVLLTIMALSLGLVSGVSFGEACGPSASCPMMKTQSMSHCQTGSAITADCCANMSPVANPAAPARVLVKSTTEVTLQAPDVTSLDAVEPVVGRPAPLASKLHDIGRHTLFQVFLS